MQKKSLFIKILVPVLIIAVIGIMWFVKNGSNDVGSPIITEPTTDQLAGAVLLSQAFSVVFFHLPVPPLY